MKIGVDGVLIGCWADAVNAKRILDVGTGCGLIAMIMAQRYTSAKITGIDVDVPSVEEARENVASSPWHNNVEIHRESFSDEYCKGIDENSKYDFVVSNPPFFNSGISSAGTARERARHQGELSPLTLLSRSRQILRDKGGVAMVMPLEASEEVEEYASSLGYCLERKCIVRGHENAPWKRVLLQWRYAVKEITDKTGLGMVQATDYLTLEEAPGIPTETYRELCKDFYLKF